MEVLSTSNLKQMEKYSFIDACEKKLRSCPLNFGKLESKKNERRVLTANRKIASRRIISSAFTRPESEQGASAGRSIFLTASDERGSTTSEIQSGKTKNTLSLRPGLERYSK